MHNKEGITKFMPFYSCTKSKNNRLYYSHFLSLIYDNADICILDSLKSAVSCCNFLSNKNLIIYCLLRQKAANTVRKYTENETVKCNTYKLKY